MDTEGNFRPERVEAIAERFGLDPTETLENVIVTRVFNHEQQIERAHVRISVVYAAAVHFTRNAKTSLESRVPLRLIDVLGRVVSSPYRGTVRPCPWGTGEGAR